MMRQEIRNLMDLLATWIIIDEGFARELAETAQQMEKDGHSMIADMYFTLSRYRRVKAIEAHAKLAALSVHYDDLLNSDLLRDGPQG
jgi:hypothetical protein